MALRLRRSGRQWLQTLKGGGSVLGGLHQRNEWEMPVSGPALDFSLPQVAEWKDILPKPLRKKLQPVFVTDFSRNSRIISWQGAQIELCMDQGEISTEHAHTPICELELELISGEPQQLFGLALAILDIVPFELESISKAEQGFRLMVGYTEQPVKALPSHLDKHDDLSKAMQALVWSCLQHFQSNLRGGLDNGNAEYLHQMRVALRRLRVLLRMAEKVCADAQLAAFRQEISAIGHMLGRIREWDVFIAHTLQPMCMRMPDDAGLQALLSSSKQQRDAGYLVLRNDVQAQDLQRLLLSFAIWMHGPYWQRHELTGLRVCDFATSYLSELASRFVKGEKHLGALDAMQLHAMRIRAKKLRYSVEFFSSLYVKQKTHKFLASLSEVQEVFGQINDDAVAQRLLDELSVTQTLSGHQDAIGLVKGWLAHDLAGRLIVLKDAVQNFCRQHRYGEK
jgi:inorganic triphosphatase YgiF